MGPTRRDMECVAFPPWWYLFIYSHLYAFELLGWQELGQVTGALSIAWIRSYDCRSSDLAAQRLLRFNPQCHHVPFLIAGCPKTQIPQIKVQIGGYISDLTRFTSLASEFF